MRQIQLISGWGVRVSICAVLSLAACLAQVASPNGPAPGSPEPWSEQPPNAQGPQDQQAPPDVAGPGVSRLSFLTGDVSVRRGDSADPVAAALNAPLLVGDIVATGTGGARAEIQFDFANRLRLGHDTEARVTEMETGRVHVEVARGTTTFSVLRDSQTQVEISTPNVSVQPLQRGLYRVLVQDDGQTVITVRQGQADIYTQRGTERINAGQTMYVRGTAQDPEFQTTTAIPFDEWDQWNQQRDQRLDHVSSYRYVSPDVYGVEDLDSYGQWQNDPAYGNVWYPQVDPGWSPYQLGRWAWEDYYGWTWISSDPWGWAPYHYGSWYRGGRGWCWYPGAISRPYFWRPALVAFFGFGGRGGIGLGFGNIGWVPLAPYERFSPWYGRGWGGGFANSRITNVNINNIYRNARVPGAVAGMSANSFQSGNIRGISRVSPQQLNQAGVVRGPLPIAPTTSNLRLTDRASGGDAASHIHFLKLLFEKPGYANQPHPVYAAGPHQFCAGRAQFGWRLEPVRRSVAARSFRAGK